jgi:hypothetical protein
LAYKLRIRASVRTFQIALPCPTSNNASMSS